MSVNTELLLKTLAHIEAHPEQWDQEHWAARTDCGTAYCFAGWACVLSGERARFAPDPIDDSRITCWLESGELIGNQARDLLGLSVSEASALFDWANTLDELRDFVSRLTGVDLEDRVVSVHG